MTFKTSITRHKRGEHATDPVSMEHDATSDYGSDFTPDEEEILYNLLQQPPSHSVKDPDLILKDLEDDEITPGARVPRLYTRQQQESGSGQASIQKQASHIAVEVVDDSNISTNASSREPRKPYGT
ncbi:MAG: hypothetical protein Q9181_004641 [Wetmoreana brouardii]